MHGSIRVLHTHCTCRSRTIGIILEGCNGGQKVPRARQPVGPNGSQTGQLEVALEDLHHVSAARSGEREEEKERKVVDMLGVGVGEGLRYL